MTYVYNTLCVSIHVSPTVTGRLQSSASFGLDAGQYWLVEWFWTCFIFLTMFWDGWLTRRLNGFEQSWLNGLEHVGWLVDLRIVFAMAKPPTSRCETWPIGLPMIEISTWGSWNPESCPHRDWRRMVSYTQKSKDPGWFIDVHSIFLDVWWLTSMAAVCQPETIEFETPMSSKIRHSGDHA